MGSACNLGGYLSLPAGLFYDWLASRGLNHLAPRHASTSVTVWSSGSIPARWLSPFRPIHWHNLWFSGAILLETLRTGLLDHCRLSG